MRISLGTLAGLVMVACTGPVAEAPALALETSLLRMGTDTFKIVELNGAEQRAVDLVYRAMPLADGFATTLPVYMLGYAERTMMPARVVSSETISVRGQPVDCWHLEVEYGPAIVEHFWIAKADRTIARIMGHAGPGIIQQYTR